MELNTVIISCHFFLIPFPTKNSELQEEWIQRVNHRNLKVNYDTQICSVHFESVDFKKRKTLPEYPYPTKYMGYELKGERTKQKRKPPIARLNSPPIKCKYTRNVL